MKKNIAFLFFSFMFTYVFSEIGMDEFFDKMNPLIEKSTEHKKIELSFKLNRRLLFSEVSNWFPFPYIDIRSSLDGIKLDKSYRALDTSASLGISQKMPLGMTLNLFGKQSCECFFDNQSDYSYKFTSGANLGLPLWFLAPSILPDFIRQELDLYKNKKKVLDFEKAKSKKKLIIKIISLIGYEKILKRKKEFLRKVQNWNYKEAEKNETLFSQGRISVLELSERDKKMRQEEILFFQIEEDYNALMDEIKGMGLAFNDLEEDVDSWLEFFEDFAFYLQAKGKVEDDPELLRHRTEWMESVKSFQNRIPNLFLSCGLDVLSSQKNYASFPAAFMGYWKDRYSLKWLISMNVRINLSPIHDDFRLNKNFKIAKEINSLNEHFLKQKIERDKNKELKNIEISRFILEKSKTALEIQEKYFILGQKLYKQGKISSHDFGFYENTLEEIKISYYSEKLSYILKVLEIYDF